MATVGSIEDVSQRLPLWARREGRGIARVEYGSEFSRQIVVQKLRQELGKQSISLQEIVPPMYQAPDMLVAFLLERLGQFCDLLQQK